MTSKDSLEKVKRKLDEGLLVDLSASSNDERIDKFESTGSSLREAIAGGALSNDGSDSSNKKRACPAKYANNDQSVGDVVNLTDDERGRPAKYCDSESSNPERACPAKYCDQQDSMKRACPAKYSDEEGHESNSESWKDSSDPVLEQVILQQPISTIQPHR